MTIIATVAFVGSHDIELNVSNHLALIKEAADAGAELIVFPEISLQGYPPDWNRFYPERIKAAYDNAEAVPDGPHVSIIAETAKELGIYVVYGLNERGTSPGVIYNTAVLTGPDGFVGKYRKVHVGITEQMTWRRGSDWPVYNTSIGRIGMLICYDKSWPESTRELTLRGADMLVMPTAYPMISGEQDPETNLWAELYQIHDRVRAAENTRWFVSSNYVGDLGGTKFVGMSQIIDPLGRVVATSGTRSAGLVIADIDISGGIADANAEHQGARLVRDRRPETYLALTGQIPPAIDG